MNAESPVADAEGELRVLASALTDPRPVREPFATSVPVMVTAAYDVLPTATNRAG